MSYKMGYDYKKYRSRDKIKKIFPFSSAEKKMATIYEDDKGKLLCFVKGAPDFLLANCSSYVNADGEVSKINSAFTNRVE
jgi:Ca2+-transporting ATPase